MEEEDKRAERDLEILKNYQKKEAKSIKKIFIILLSLLIVSNVVAADKIKPKKNNYIWLCIWRVYKRTLAECFVTGESLSSFLVRSGYAFAYRKYSKKFIKDEDFAKANKLGMWAMTFQYPWDFRKASWKNF